MMRPLLGERGIEKRHGHFDETRVADSEELPRHLDEARIGDRQLVFGGLQRGCGCLQLGRNCRLGRGCLWSIFGNEAAARERERVGRPVEASMFRIV